MPSSDPAALIRDIEPHGLSRADIAATTSDTLRPPKFGRC
jgi:hypothetical protein